MASIDSYKLTPDYFENNGVIYDVDELTYDIFADTRWIGILNYSPSFTSCTEFLLKLSGEYSNLMLSIYERQFKMIKNEWVLKNEKVLLLGLNVNNDNVDKVKELIRSYCHLYPRIYAIPRNVQTLSIRPDKLKGYKIHSCKKQNNNKCTSKYPKLNVRGMF